MTNSTPRSVLCNLGGVRENIQNAVIQKGLEMEILQCLSAGK